jgi:hypothetical protein
MALHLSLPQFLTDDVVSMTGIKSATIDYWVKLGHIELDARPRNWNTGIYSASDVLKICGAAELRRAGLAVSDHTADLADAIARQCRLWYHQEHGKHWDGASPEARNHGRLLIITIDTNGRQHASPVGCTNEPADPQNGRFVIDCFALAERVMPQMMAVAEVRKDGSAAAE